MCDINKCKRLNVVGYSAFGQNRNKEVSVCEYHWVKHCDDNDKFDIRKHFYPTWVAEEGG